MRRSESIGQITEIDIKRKLEGIKEIIIKVVFNEKSEELHFKIGDLNSANEMANKTFEFKPTSRKDHFEFIMKGINERNQIFDIGSKVFPLNEISSHEEYLVQIVVPEIENEEQIAAYIKAKIVLYWSDYKYYEKQKKKSESKLKKITIAKNKADDYLRKVREIYGDLTRKKPDLIVDFNNEKLMQRKGAKLSVNFNNTKEAEATGNYVVEFNNQKEVQIKQEIKKEIKQEIKEEPVVEVTQEINTKQEEVNLVAPPEEEEYVDTNEQINYEEYQANTYEPVQENITGIETTEIVKETEIRNSIHDAVIRQSMNKPMIQENTLPVIRQEKVNKVIYDTNVTTLPVIFGGKKVTYLSLEESQKYDFNSLLQGAEEIQGEAYNTNIQGETFNTVIQGQEYNTTNVQELLGQDYTQINQGQDFITQIGQTQDYTQVSQVQQDFSNVNPEQGVGFEEYKRSSY